MSRYAFPSTDELVREIREGGYRSFREWCRERGYTRTSLQDELHQRGEGARAQVFGAINANKNHRKAPPGVDKSAHTSPSGVDVTTQEGRRVANLEAALKESRSKCKQLEEHILDQENLVERIIAATSNPLPGPNFSCYKGGQPGKGARDAILPLFDMQFGQRVRRVDTPARMNEFNVEVFTRRLERYVDAVTGLLEDYSSSHLIENLIIPLGGDMVEGEGIFRGQEWQLELDPVEQVLGLKGLLGSALHEIIGVAREEMGVHGVGIFCVPGNHGKIGGKKSGATPSTMSWDYLLFEMLKDHLQRYPIEIFAIEPAGSIVFESQGWVFRVIHGDEVRGWGGIPFYGLGRYDAKAVRLHNQIFHYLLLGHHHQPASIPVGDGEHLMSGNWVGTNNLSTKITAAGRPSQWVYFCAREFGVGDRSLIYLDSGEERPKPAIHSFAS